MTVTQEQIGGESDPYYEGDSLEITVDVNKEDGSDKDLTGASAEFAVKETKGGPVVWDDDDSGVSLSIDTTNDEVNITFGSGVTSEGEYWWYLRVTDAAGHPDTVVEGDFIVDAR